MALVFILGESGVRILKYAGLVLLESLVTLGGGWGQAFLLTCPDVEQERKNWHLRFINNRTLKNIQNITPAFKGVIV